MISPVLKRDTRSGYQIGHRSRYKYLARLGNSRYPCTDVDSDSPNVLPTRFDLSGMKTNPNLDVHLPRIVPDGTRALDRAARTVESREEPVTCCLDLSAPKSAQLATDYLVVDV